MAVNTSSYVDLTVYDSTPEEVYAASVEYAQLTLPEWTPSPGSIEDAILQSSVSMTSELKGAINRLPGSLVEVILQLFGVARNSGEKATGTVTVTMIDDSGYALAPGTRFAYLDSTSIDDPVIYAFDTTEELVVAPGSFSGEVAIIATRSGLFPSLGTGDALTVITPSPYIDSVELYEDLSIGSSSESDEEYFERAVTLLNSYSGALTLPSQYEAYIVGNYPEVVKCKAYTRLNPASDLLASVLQNGYLTVYVAKSTGGSVTPSTVTAIQEDIQDKGVAGLVTTVKNSITAPIDVSVDIVVDPSYLGSTVQASVKAAVESYLSPSSWDWESTIYLNELVSLVDRIAGVKRVASIEIETVASDYSFTNYGTLPLATATVLVV